MDSKAQISVIYDESEQLANIRCIAYCIQPEQVNLASEEILAFIIASPVNAGGFFRVERSCATPHPHVGVASTYPILCSAEDIYGCNVEESVHD